jgi:hypothetical protein
MEKKGISICYVTHWFTKKGTQKTEAPIDGGNSMTDGKILWLNSLALNP